MNISAGNLLLCRLLSRRNGKRVPRKRREKYNVDQAAQPAGREKEDTMIWILTSLIVIDSALLITGFAITCNMYQDCASKMEKMGYDIVEMVFKTIGREEDSIIVRGLFGGTLRFRDFSTVGVVDDTLEYIERESNVIIHDKIKGGYYFFTSTRPEDARCELIKNRIAIQSRTRQERGQNE